jgi:methionyl aminopeptidase
MIVLKSRREIELMRQAGRLAAQVLDRLEAAVRPGTRTRELDALAEEFIRGAGAVPAFKGYRGFPASICVSVNDEVVHGIPGQRVLREGDIVSVDVGVLLGGYVGDAARTFPVGEVGPLARRLLEVTQQSLRAGIDRARPGGRLGDISHAVQRVVEAAGFSVVRRYAGHGVGRSIHEDPEVPNFGSPGRGPRLEPGLVLAIEPMVNAGTHEVVVDDNAWTVRTADGSLSAHFEHTVAITADGPEILTLPPGGA